MKNIYFDDTSNLKQSRLKFSLLILSIILILFGRFTNTFSEYWNNKMEAIGFFYIGFYYLSKIIRKNYVQWNKIGMTVRINNYIREQRITFYDVKSYEFKDDKLRIFQSNKTVELDLNNITDSDKERLIQIIADNTVSNNS